MKQPLYVMVGGFLGAGKTTSIARLARRLVEDGRSVGIITNDQGSELVDTALLRSLGFAVEEITGGCFCCRFDSLREAAERLRVGERSQLAPPDVFLAEPVGSCTDLVATVAYPLRRLWGDGFRIAPLSVVVDPVRALRVLGREDGKRFSRNVSYVYRKQLEEADVIAINKIDAIEPRRRKVLRSALEEEFPRTRVFEVSARSGDGTAEWFDHLLAIELLPGRALEIDYDRYADGEALLGWVDATVMWSSPQPADGNALLADFACALRSELGRARAEVAHLKMTLSPRSEGGNFPGEVASLSLVRDDLDPELGRTLSAPAEGGVILVNLRAEAAPEDLRVALERATAAVSLDDAPLAIEHVDFFRPGRPQPTHRLAGWAPASPSAQNE